MKSWKGLVLYIGAFFLQPFLFNLLPVAGVTPNLILILTVMITFLYDDESELLGIVLGVIFALLNDVAFGLYIGPGAIAILVSGLMVFFLKGFTNKENIINAILTIVISTWVYASVYWLVYIPLGSTYSYIYAMKSIPWQLLYNVIVAIILYLILIKKVIKHRRDRYFR